MFRVLDATVFEQCFRSCVSALVGVVDGVIALDGKTVCGSRDGENTALHMVSAFATASGLCLRQEGTRGKGNEIAAIKALLHTLTLKGCIVTIDAIRCQTDIAQQIVERRGDYLLAVKDNQRKLADALREFFAEADARGFGTLPYISAANPLDVLPASVARHAPDISGNAGYGRSCTQCRGGRRHCSATHVPPAPLCGTVRWPT